MFRSSSIFRKIALFAGLALAGTFTFSAMAQLTNPPAGGNVTVTTETGDPPHKGVLKERTDPPAAGEARDIVMIGSTMNYFVMPDRNYNPLYFAQPNVEGSWANTNLTKSIFDWRMVDGANAAVTTGFGFEFKNPNETLVNPTDDEGTSPWAKIEWNTLGTFSIQIRELPEALKGTDCYDNIEPAVIPITVIDLPNIAFDEVDGSLDVLVCDPLDDLHEAEFPITVQTYFFDATMNDKIWVTYTVTRTSVDGTEDTDYDNDGDDVEIEMVVEGTPGAGGLITLKGFIPLEIEEHGFYEVTIISVVDHIGRKCDVVSEDVIENRDVFTYAVLDAPKPGRTFHVPNNNF